VRARYLDSVLPIAQEPSAPARARANEARVEVGVVVVEEEGAGMSGRARRASAGGSAARGARLLDRHADLEEPRGARPVQDALVDALAVRQVEVREARRHGASVYMADWLPN
jgi:hypothetical protein